MRAAAVSSLARFGSLVQDLRPRILVLLQRALHDNDDEVRLPPGRPPRRRWHPPPSCRA